jgi:McKusick-Kaufman syndrome protein
MSALQGEQDLKLRFEHPDRLKVAVVCVSMSGDTDDALSNIREAEGCTIKSAGELVLSHMFQFCDWLLASQVGLLLCQKVIHPKVKAYLRKQGILFVERLGLPPMSYVQDLTGKFCLLDSFFPLDACDKQCVVRVVFLVLM